MRTPVACPSCGGGFVSRLEGSVICVACALAIALDTNRDASAAPQIDDLSPFDGDGASRNPAPFTDRLEERLGPYRRES